MSTGYIYKTGQKKTLHCPVVRGVDEKMDGKKKMVRNLAYLLLGIEKKKWRQAKATNQNTY